MKYINLFLLAFFCKSSLLAQKLNKEPLKVYLKEFSIYFTPDSCEGKNVIDLLTNTKIIANFQNCKGTMIFKQYDVDGNLLLEGAYQATRDTLKKIFTSRSAVSDEKRRSVGYYYQPLPEGVWIYYRNGKKIQTKHYLNGVLVSCE